VIFREVEDRDLIGRARRGEVEAYNLLISRWEKHVFNYLLRLVGDREDALDLSQETFLKAYQNLGRLEDQARFWRWLFRIAHNEAYSLLRRRRPEGEPPPQLPVETASYGLYPAELSLAVQAAPAHLTGATRAVATDAAPKPLPRRSHGPAGRLGHNAALGGRPDLEIIHARAQRAQLKLEPLDRLEFGRLRTGSSKEPSRYEA